MSTPHRLFVRLTVTHPEGFAEEIGATPEDILAGMMKPPADPEAAGFRIISSSLLEEKGQILIEVAAEVQDADKLFAAARQAYRDCWSDGHWSPDHPEEALYELLFASNANPSPDQMGFAFEAWGPLPPLHDTPQDNEDPTP